MLSLTSLAFNAVTTPNKELGLSSLQLACIQGDIGTFSDILNHSPSKLDSVIAVSVKIGHRSSHFPGKSVWAVLTLQHSVEHRQLRKLVDTVFKDCHSQSLIHLAARSGQVHHLRRVLDCGEQVNSVAMESSGETPLILASRFNDEDVVEFLVERGASLEMCDSRGCTPFHHAAEVGKLRNMLRLIELGADVFKLNFQGYSAFHLAVASGRTEALRLLIEHGLDVNKATTPSTTDSSSTRYTPLMLAAEKGHAGSIHLLLNNGGELNKENEIGWLPLHSAAAGDHTNVVKFLIEKGRNWNALPVTRHGTTVLHLATRLELVRLLVEEGADIRARDNRHKTPLHVASEKGQTDTVNYLLNQGADVNARDEDGLIALYYALKEGHATTAKVLIDKGSDSMLINDKNVLEFHEADLLKLSARKGSTAVLQLLLNRGLSADTVHSESSSLLTPLEEASSNGQCDAVTFLLERGASINGDVDSRAELLHNRHLDVEEYWKNISPLYAALHARQAETAKLLIERGADISNLDSSKIGSLKMLAAEHGLLDVLGMLCNHTLDDVESFSMKNAAAILTSAAFRTDIDVVSRHLQNGLDVNARAGNGNTALHIALLRGAHPKLTEMVKLLVEFGADINAKNNKLETPLHFAADLNSEEIGSLLIELECEANCEDSLTRSPLHRAVGRRNSKVTEMLLQYGLAVNQKCCREETTPLHVAVAVAKGSKSVHIPQVLLQHGADTEAKNALGETPLASAVATNGGNFSLVQFFLLEGSSVNTQDKIGETPLMKAVRNAVVPVTGYTNIVEVLLEHGSSVNNIDQYGRTPLHFIPSCTGVEVCQLLLDHGCDVNLADYNGETPLHVAATGNPEIVERLLQQGAHVGTLDRDNRCPLHAAAYSGDCRSVELLIQRGADVHLADSQGWSPLHFAAAGGNFDNVKILIQGGSNVKAVDGNGRTALHLAAKRGFLYLVKLLVDHGSDINATDFNGQSVLSAMYKLTSLEYYLEDPLQLYLDHGGDKLAVDDETGRTTLHFGVTQEFVSSVNSLLDEGLDIEAIDKNGDTPLHRAAMKGTEEMLQLLIDRGADLTAVNSKGQTPLLASLANHKSNLLLKHVQNFQIADNYGNTALHLGIYRPSPDDPLLVDPWIQPSELSKDDIIFLLNAGASVHCRDTQENTPLHIAAAENRCEIAELLIKEGSDVNATNMQGRTCLHMATCSRTGVPGTLQMLILHGADVNAVDELGSTPLHIAFTLPHLSMVEPLLKHGSDPKAVDYKGCTPLHLGCCFCYLDASVISIMIEHGSDLEARDNKGCTPLHLCTVFDRTRAARNLLEHGADVDARDNEGSTPLHLAAAFCDSLSSVDNEYSMIFLLLKHGANVNLRDSEGSIALHTAAAFGEVRIVRKLIFAGSDVNALDVRGDTPLTVSAGSGHLDVVRLLVDNGADLFTVNKQGLTAAKCAKKFGHEEVEQYLDQLPDSGV